MRNSVPKLPTLRSFFIPMLVGIGMLMGYTAFNPTALAAPTTPGTINYQGRLLNATNLPLTGNYDFRFSLWTDADVQAGESGAGFACALPRCSWFETQTKTTDTYGLFNTLVGSSTPLPSFDFTSQKFLQVEVRASGVGNYEVLDPDGVDNLTDRKAVTSFPYASNADTLDNANVGTAAGDIPALGAGGLLNVATIPTGTNQSSFEIDADHNAGVPVELRFGDPGTTEVLSWDPNGVGLGDGWFNFSDDVKIQGLTELQPIAAPGVTTDRLYNVGGTLTWNGAPVGGGAHAQNTDTGTNNLGFKVNNTSGVGDANLTFGTTLGDKILNYVVGSTWFNFNDDVNVTGNLTVTGTINGVSVGAYNQTMSLEPEYNNTVQYLPGADQGKLELLYDNANNLNNYKWTTTNAALQEMQVVIRILLPTGFTGWQATPFNFTYKTGTALIGNNVIDVQVFDTAGAPVVLTGASNLVNAAWTTANITFGGGETWIAGNPITIKIRMRSLTPGGACYASTLNLNYTGK